MKINKTISIDKLLQNALLIYFNFECILSVFFTLHFHIFGHSFLVH